jgi:hypothetical protein
MDGFYDEGKKFLSSIFKSLSIGAIAGVMLFDGTWKDIIYFLLCWWIIFDMVYNTVRGLGLFYVGKTKWTDRLIRWAFRTNAPHFSFITKLMALIAAIGLRL